MKWGGGLLITPDKTCQDIWELRKLHPTFARDLQLLCTSVHFQTSNTLEQDSSGKIHT